MYVIYSESTVIKELKDFKFPDECITCPKAELCRGGAKCLTYALTGDYNHKDPNCYYPDPAPPKTTGT